jgi:hypothetical protein
MLRELAATHYCGKLLFAAGVFLPSEQSYSHHAFAAHYDPQTSVVISGEVVSFAFINPHTRLHLAVKDRAGEVIEWLIEGDSRSVLIRSGWTDDFFAVGEHVRVEGWMARDGSPAVYWSRITKDMDDADVSTYHDEFTRLIETAESLRRRSREAER